MLMQRGATANGINEECWRKDRGTTLRAARADLRRLREHLRPAVSIPMQRPDGKGGETTPRPVVKMAAKPESPAVGDNPGMAGANKRAVGLEEDGSATGQQVLAITSQIGASNRGAAAYANLVGAIGAAAAKPPVDEKIVIRLMIKDEGCFDGRVPGEGIKG